MSVFLRSIAEEHVLVESLETAVDDNSIIDHMLFLEVKRVLP